MGTLICNQPGKAASTANAITIRLTTRATTLPNTNRRSVSGVMSRLNLASSKPLRLAARNGADTIMA